jgi:two-component system, OmpR family, phosphate regulon sensor histidine kinase PhoR
MTKRIFWSIFSVVLVILICCVGLVGGVVFSDSEKQLQEELAQESTFVAQGYRTNGEGYLTSLQNISTRITLVAADGTVLYDNEADPATMANHNDREEIIEARSGGVGDSIRYSSTLKQETIYHALLLDNGQVMRVSITENSALALIEQLIEPVGIILTIVIVLSAFLAYYLARRVTQSINSIDLEHPENYDTYEELSPLLVKLYAQNKTIAKQMEELRRTQAEFAQITEHMQEGLVMMDARGDVIFFNQKVSDLFGFDGMPVHHNIVEINRSEQFRTVVATALSGSNGTATVMIGARYYQLIASPVFGDRTTVAEDDNVQPVVSGAVLLLIDVTEKHDWEKLRAEFAANVSHELKTPLTSLSGIAEIIRNGMVASDDIPHFAGKIYDEAQRLIQLVSDIIEISKLDERDIVYEQEPVDLLDLASDMCFQLQDAADTKAMSVTLSGDHVEVQGVRRILEEMIYNLIDNAIKYTPFGGSVRVKVSTDQPEGHIVLSVSDTGIGIPVADLDRVFERFYRVDKSRSQESPGTGLGLSIVKHAAAYHGAEVSIESIVGTGTTVRVVWP